MHLSAVWGLVGCLGSLVSGQVVDSDPTTVDTPNGPLDSTASTDSEAPTDSDPACEGTTREGTLGWLSATRTSESPRPLRRCSSAAAQAPFHWLDEHCPEGVNEEAMLGYVR